jgi:parallel beta-helix repeat protein
MKWDVGQVTVRNAYVHGNDCRGLWADINAHDALIEHNLVEDNRAEGILYEISQDAVIRNNRVYRNGLRASGWYWDGGIVVASSFNVEIYGNRLSSNYNGITGTQQDRFDSTRPSICSTITRSTTTSSAPPATGGTPPASAPTMAPTSASGTSASPAIPSSRPRASSGPSHSRRRSR